MIRSSALAIAALLVAWMLAVTPVLAQDDARAGLVIVHGDGQVTMQCVAFAEPHISGYELLKRAGAPMSVEAGAIGATICSIDGEGCSFPQESCFCRCQGSPCTYWSYWRQSAEGWQYQNSGAGNTQVRNGDVEAWHWASGTTEDAKKPPELTFAAICAAEPAAQAVASAPVLTSTAPATVAAQKAFSSTATPAPAAVTTPSTATPAGSLTVLGVVLLGLVVMPFAAGAVLLLIRKQQGK